VAEVGHCVEKADTRLILCWESVTGQRSNQLNYVPYFVFLPLSETRVFSGFPQVQSIRLCRLFQPRITEFRG
jgi:hypothetical protein